MPIDDQPIKKEVSILKKLVRRLGKISEGIFGNVFDVVRKFKSKEESAFYTAPENEFVKFSADIVSDILSRNEQGLVLTFDLRTRELAEKIKSNGLNTANLFFLDCISYFLGKGTPPIHNVISLNRPDDFENLFYYTLIQLRRLNTFIPFLIVIAPHKLLKYQDYNEVGLFFKSFTDKFKKKGIPVIFIYPDSADPILKRILSNLVPEKITV
jgi:hypothetical protein